MEARFQPLDLCERFKTNRKVIKRWLAEHGLTIFRRYRFEPPFEKAICIGCGIEKPGAEFMRYNGRGPRQRCLACIEAGNIGRGGQIVIDAGAIRAFWSKVVTREGDECWLWNGDVSRTGYAEISYDGTKIRANRFSYVLHTGEQPDEKSVCHSCDNRRCTNPLHLFVGTIADNTRDRDTKNRVQWGERHWAAKLTANDVRLIRESSESVAELAKKYGVHTSTIYTARDGKKWARLN